MSFESLGLSLYVLKAISAKGYEEPSDIQKEAIPAILAKKDVIAGAQTGTGKTAAFVLPLLDRLQGGQAVKHNQARVLILTPTRELAMQIEESIKDYGIFSCLSSAVVYGGVKINPQMMRLRRGVDFLVATPGRLLDLYSKNAIGFKHLEALVLDEADRMLDMGFQIELNKIMALLPKRRQTLLFSATFNEEIMDLAEEVTYKAQKISVTPENSTAEKVTQWVHPVDKNKKPALLHHLIEGNNWEQVLVFTKTKQTANQLAGYLLTKGLKATAFHGNRSQLSRTHALERFKDGDLQVLVATDIAARGLDIELLPQVVNYDMPKVARDYVHRIGRTGRAGAEGVAISLVTHEDFEQMVKVEQEIQQQIPRQNIAGFYPQNPLPESPEIKPLKKKKPKKNKKKHNPVEHLDGQRAVAKKKGPSVTPATPRRTSVRKPEGSSGGGMGIPRKGSFFSRGR